MSTQPTSPFSADKIDEVIDLTSLFEILTRFKWVILCFSLVVTSLVAWYTTKLPPIYQATATLLLEVSEVKAVSIEEVVGLDSSRQEYFQTQYEILKSRHLAEKVIKRLHLQSLPEFSESSQPNFLQTMIKHVKAPLGLNDTATSTSEENEQRLALIATFLEKLTVAPVKKTQLVNLSFESEDPQLAAQVVNTLGEVYIASHLQDKMNVTLQASDWIKSRLDELKIKLQFSETKLQAFRESNDLVDVTGVVSLVSQELNELTSQLGAARQKRTQALASLSFLKEQDIDDVEQLAVMPLFANHKTIQEIKKDQLSAENAIAELSMRYGPKHNKMIAAKARLAEIEATLTKRVKRLAEGVEQQYQAALENEKELNAELASVRGRYQEVSRLETEYRVLSREVMTNRQLYDTFLTRMKETRAASDFQSAHARFTDKAEAPSHPAKPKKKFIVALALVSSLMLGVILVLVYEFLKGTIKSASDAEHYLGLRVLGVTPEFKRKGAEKALPLDCFSEQNTELFNEVWRTLRTGYLMTHHGLSSKVVSITSTVPGEGKSTTSINLAHALSQVEKVLLIEADLRRPSLAKRFNLLPNQPGFFNVLAGTHGLMDCICQEPKSGMDVMVAGTQVSTPLELLSTPALPQLIQTLKQHYDRIVIDTPPVHVVSDALVMAKVSDSFLFVVRADKVHQKQAKEALERLRHVHAKIDGVVLNDVPRKTASTYYGYKYKGYYSYDEAQSSGHQLPPVADLIPLPLVDESTEVIDLIPRESGMKDEVVFAVNTPSSASEQSSAESQSSSKSRSLSADEKFHLHLEKAKRAMGRQDYAKARKHLTHIYKLNIDLPLSFYYRMAHTMYMSGEKEQAQKTASYYMKKAGKSGKYYEAARKLVG